MLITRHTNTRLAILSFALLAVLSCSKEQTGTPDETSYAKGKELIEFSVEDIFHAETKVTEVTDANLTRIYVTATKGTPGQASGSGAETAAFTSAQFDSDGASPKTFKGDKWWPLSDPGYHFYGSNIAQSFSAGACTISASNTTDVVCAYMATPTYKSKNTLVFLHVLARIGTVTFSAPSGYEISGITTRITPYVSGTYNIRTGNGYTDGTGWSGLVAGPQTTLSASANDLYLVPGTYTLTVTYTLAKRGVTSVIEWQKQYTRTATVLLQAGYTNNLVGTVTGGEATEIILSISLNPWSEQNHTPSFN